MARRTGCLHARRTGLCGARCIGPILAFLGGLGVLSALGALCVPALTAVIVLTLAATA
ncbi:hypothetical protein ACFXD5_05625 [Streptomyces sp. NPDC059385]|uniref:hypothetical protein n=1 Tax=Streptomyces sp. NPDC059385 TaxID=3346817 RepID=UPI0036C31E40